MTDLADKKEALKKHVRALLVSSPVELTVRELERDFHTFIGIPLDYRGIGYASAEDFIRDIEDAVYITWKNGMMTLKAKCDETDKHIANLVSKQKVSNKTKFAVYRNKRQPRYSSGPPRYSSGPPRFSSGPSRFSSGPPRFNDRFKSDGNYAPPKRIIPAFVRHQVEGLFRAFPSGLSIKDIDTAFGRKYGTRLLFRNYGFDTMLELFENLSDLVKIESSEEENRIVPVGYVRSSSREERGRHSSGDNDRTTHSRPQGAHTSDTSDSNNNRNRPSKGRGRRRQESGDCEGQVGQDAQSVTSSGSGGSSKSYSGRMEILEQEIRQVLEKHAEGIWAARFPHEYSDLHGKPLDYRDYGYLSVVDFISSMPDTVKIERPSPRGDWLLYDARITPPKHTHEEPTPPSNNSERRQRHSSGKSLLEDTQEKIQQVLQSRPHGIRVSQFPQVFKEHTGQELPVRELGFEAPHELCLSMADTILQVAYVEHVGTVLYLADADLSQVHTDDLQEPEPPVDSSRPSDVVGPGCHYMPVMCPDAYQYTGLYVSNIVNPGLFWVILRHKEKSLALENLMDRLDEAYTQRCSDQYKMPESLMVPGQLCATLFPEDNNWHRGVITGANDDGFISVYFVDYGNTSYVDKSTLRFLKREFLSLPAQAIQARLANVHPPAAKWKVKSRNRLLEMCRQKALVAYITKVKCQIMSVCLTDTNDPTVDVHINDTLVKDGYAIFCPDEEYDQDLQLQQHAEVPNYSHVFGTTQAPRLPHAAGDNNSSSTATEDTSAPDTVAGDCLVKWVQLTKDHVLHIINLDRVAHVVSAEVSSFIWEEDILSSMLKQKKMDVPKTVIDSDKYPGLFQDLTRYEVKSMKAEMLGRKQFLSLYPLDSVPAILRVFLPDREDLVSSVEELVAKFDPDSQYWKSCEVKSHKAEPSPSLPSEEEMNITYEDKEMALQALQIRRKRILQKLMSEPTSTEITVNELNRCEIEIMMIKQELEDSRAAKSTGTVLKEASLGTLGQTVSPPPTIATTVSTAATEKTSDLSETQRAIQNIIASSTKPIATANIMTKPTVSIASQSSNTVTSLPSANASFVNQSAAGSFPGMMGMNTFAQQQRFVNPYLLAQTGMMPNQEAVNLSQMLGTRMPMGVSPGLNPAQMPGLMQGLDPALLQGTGVAGTQSVLNPALLGQMGGAPVAGFGRGQAADANSMGLLPGLMPLLQNLTMGRGGGRGGSQDPRK